MRTLLTLDPKLRESLVQDPLRYSPPIAELTDKEVALVQFFVRNPARVLTRENILEEVWGHADAPTASELDELIAHLRGCVEREPSHPRYIVTARGVGYRFEP